MPHAPDLSGRALDGRYELHAVIGEGAFGRVYRGRDRRLARPVAVKVIKPWWAEDPEWVRSFEREAQLLARVNDPGIVQIFDVGYADEGLYYVAELVDGESLASRLRRGPLAPAEACEMAEQLCLALAQAHAQNVVHRDIKPANVLISARGRVKVGDFGVARLAEGSTDGASATIVGTPRYMAPEQARGRPTSPATDVYGAGVVLYEMLAGRPPFMERSAVELALRHLHDPPPPLPRSTPPMLVEIVQCALQKDPARRYPDGGAMADALARAQTSVSAARGARPGVEPAATPSGSRPAGTPSGPGRLTTPPGPGRLATPSRSGSAATPSRSGSAATPSRSGRVATLPPRRRGAPRTGAAPASSVSSAASASAAGTRSATAATRVLSEDAVGTASTEWLERELDQITATRVAPPMGPRRNQNPPARRRRGVAIALVGLILLSMVGGAILIGSHGQVRVPDLRGLRKASVTVKTRAAKLDPAFIWRYNSAPKGIAIAQTPSPGTRVTDGGSIRVVLSAGPAPVTLPQVVGGGATAATAALQHLGLRTELTQVPAPGVAPGLVTHQSPAAGSDLARHAMVTLSVAETPRWRPLTSWAGDSDGRSVPFRIRGTQWRVVYGMGYEGLCTFIFICSGPSAQVVDLNHPSDATKFDLNKGSDQTQVFKAGAGLYQISIQPGSDTAHWSMEVEDYY
jgi:eukaryotic-like serine/threonine-protein kinase